MMKKRVFRRILTMFVLFSLLLNLTSVANARSVDIGQHVGMMIGQSKAIVNGEIAKFDANDSSVTPVVSNGKQAAPIGLIAAAFGASVSYNETQAAMTINRSHGKPKVIAVAANGATGKAWKQGVTIYMMVKDLAELFDSHLYTDDKGLIVISDKKMSKKKDDPLILSMIESISGDKYVDYDGIKDYVDVDQLKANLTFPKVTPDTVASSFKPELTGVHPRLLANSDDFQRMKQWIASKDPYFLAAFNSLKTSADGVMKLPVTDFAFDDARRIFPIHNYVGQGITLAMTYMLTGDRKYADKLWEQLDVMTRYPDWGAQTHFLDTAVDSDIFAISYDWLYNYWSDTQKAAMEDAMLRLALIPGQTEMDNNAWWHTINNNWNGVTHGGLILAALAIYEKNPTLMKNIIASSVDKLPNYIREFEPDGQNAEGLSYWNYGLSNMITGLEAMSRVLGTDFGLSATDGMRKTGYFPLNTAGPIASLNLGDDAIKTSVSGTMMWFAKKYRDTALAKYQYDYAMANKAFSVSDMLSYDPSLLTGDSQVQLNLDNYTREVDLLTFQEKLNDKNASFVAVHGGENTASHGHLDAGSFYIQARGKYWAYGDLGPDNYVFPGYFNTATHPDYEEPIAQQTTPGRWQFYRMRAEGKNAVVINPDIRPDQNPLGTAKVESFVSKPKGGFTILDLSNVYKRDVSSYERGVMLGTDRRLITVQDEIKTLKDSQIWWFMHTAATITVRPDGKSAILEIDGDKMLVSIASPDNATFKVMDAAYLPNENFPLTQNTVNKGYRKLAIELNGVKKTTISVNFAPLEMEQDKPLFEVPAVKPLKKWAITDGPKPALPAKPKLNGISVEGTPLAGFKPDQPKYDLPIPIDGPWPAITATSNQLVTIRNVEAENKVVITVTDRQDPLNQNNYVVMIRKRNLPVTVPELSIKGVTATLGLTPQPQYKPENTLDGDTGIESRWSAQGIGQWIQYELPESRTIRYLGLATAKATERSMIFNVETSEDSTNWTKVYEGQTSGATLGLEAYGLTPTIARFVRIVCFGNNNGTDWNSITEVKLFGQ